MLKFNNEEVGGLVARYYKDNENRDIKLRVFLGRIRPITKLNEYALSIDLIEHIVVDGEAKEVATSITKDEFDRAVSSSLQCAGFAATDIKLEYKGCEEKYEFAGIAVDGEKKNLEHTI